MSELNSQALSPVLKQARKRPVTQPDKRFTYHLKRLANKPISTIQEVYETCKPSQRDLGKGPGLVYNRYLAAKFLLELAENLEPAKLNLYLDRTEGKVADVVVTGSFEDLVSALEHGRQRLLSPIAEPQAAIEGEVINPHIESHPVSIPTESTTTK